jgi:hypothetical protein
VKGVRFAGAEEIYAVDLDELAAWALEGRLDLAGMVRRKSRLDDDT